MNGPTLVFTTFWRANNLRQSNPNNDSELVYSIALSAPSEDKIPFLKHMKKLDFFCPTWKILKRYKQDSNWELYTQSFMELMRTRKPTICQWINNLQPNTTCLLCCWENTSNGAHCHRQLIYEAFKKSKTYNKRLTLIYQDC